MTPTKNGMYLYGFLCVNGAVGHTYLIFPVTFKICTGHHWLVLLGASGFHPSNGWLGLENSLWQDK